MVMQPWIWKASGFLTTFDHNFDQNGGESERKYRNIRTVCGGKSEKNGLKRAITSQKRKFWTFGTQRPQVRILSSRPHENNPNILLFGESFGLFVLFEYPNFNSKK